MTKRLVRASLLLIILSACAPATPTPFVPTQGGPAPASPSSSIPEAAQLPWWREVVFYEIFVRSFYDTDGNGIGDFNGITQKLDYLQELGVNAIWLMPIHPSPSYHGYDVLNYYAVNTEYGTMDDFKNLLREAHNRDMRIIIDLILNHTSSQHPWFVDANRSPDSAYRDYYVWSDARQGNYWSEGQNGYYFSFFCDCMPDLNYRNPEVTAQMEKVIRFWLEDIGVDGFRVDAAKHLIEEDGKVENTAATHEWYKGFYTFYKSQNPQAYTVGEAYGGGAFVAGTYQEQFDHIFNFEFASGFMSSAQAGTNSPVNSAIKFALADKPDFDFATFLTNHDQNRVMSVLDGNVDQAKVAASLLLTSPGTPFIYYGEEIGMQGEKPDEDIRLPMQWNSEASAGFTSGRPWRAPAQDYEEINVAAQDQQADSLLNHYRELLRLRAEHTALSSSDIVLLETENPSVYAVLRSSADERILVLINLEGTPISDYLLSLGESLLLTAGEITPLTLFGTVEATPVTVSEGKFTGYKPVDELSPYGTYIFQLE
ncbi:MAG: alpha-amylase family glycosyl hydrolase [Chloroflexota bacterium]